MTRLFQIPLLALALTLGLSAAAPSPAQALRPDEDRRVETYERFRALFDAGKYDEALPLAHLLVRLTEVADPQHEELPTAYNNLGVVQFRLGDLDGAESSFDTALETLEKTEAISSRRLISPLAGLGAVYAASGQPARAADVLHRAIAISRRANGLFNVDQLELIEALVAAYETLGNLEGIERERRYELQIVQQAYGHDDPRTLPAVTRFAEWLEKTDRWPAARVYWAKAVEIGMREGGGRNAATINGLLGVARSHRLQYVRDPESLSGPPTVVDPTTGRPEPIPYATDRVYGIKLDDGGERAALQALEILDSTTDPPRVLLVNVLMELGDWYITEHRPEKAVPYYQRAWPLMSASVAEEESNPLLRPRPLQYRTPAAARRSLASGRGRTVSSPIEFSMTITARGEAEDITLVNDAPENRASQVRRALERAWFSPRFENGQPVATDGFRFTDHWFELANEPEQDTAGKEMKEGDAEPDQGEAPVKLPAPDAPSSSLPSSLPPGSTPATSSRDGRGSSAGG
jgi:tetratricopeptide (TPR) repeat protein